MLIFVIDRLFCQLIYIFILKIYQNFNFVYFILFYFTIKFLIIIFDPYILE